MNSILGLLALVALTHLSQSLDISKQGRSFLEQYGYVGKSDPRSGNILSPEAFEDAIKEYQRRSGLTVTGKMDAKTMEMMEKPRCGVKDVGGITVSGADSIRSKRFNPEGSTWPIRSITYRITDYGRTRSGLTRSDMDREISRAWKIWSDHTNLQFRQVSASDVSANIEIFFKRGAHGDGNAFDGPSRVLAHAYFPRFGGDAHFDDDENFTQRTRAGVNLFLVAAHEFGHSLGLLHSDHPDALMAPVYAGYQANYQLHQDDVAGIQRLYGVKTSNPGTPDATPPPTRPVVPVTRPPTKNCVNSKIDGVTTTSDGKTYIFQGENYQEVYYSRTARRMVARDPRRITDDWSGLEGNIDAVLTYGSRTYFFKDTRTWLFVNKRNWYGRAYPISTLFRGLPSNLDAAFVWSGNGRRYFIKGTQYYRITYSSVDRGYPRPLSVWSDKLSRVDSVFQWVNDRTYFFVNDVYYRFNDDDFSFDAGYPANTGRVWLGCINNLINSNLVHVDKDYNNGTVSDDNNVKLAQQSYTVEQDGGTGSAGTLIVNLSLLFVSLILLL